MTTSRTLVLLEPSRSLRKLFVNACAARGVAVSAHDSIGSALVEIATSKPVAILTARELPGLPGESLVAALKSSRHHRAIPIALLTSSADEHEAASTFSAGCAPDRIIVKGTGLLDDVAAFLESIGLPLVAGGAAAAPCRLAGRILLAEDGRSNQMILGHILHVAGADVVVANDGVEAVEAASREAVDLVLMDVEMPNMDGRQATVALRRNGKLMPILALTAHDPELFRAEAERHGFTAVVPKSLSKADLVACCASHLGKALTPS